ncbi:iron-containing redox enzyme family protein [Frankia sp. R82]|uniref:iron-containing redox enzyme family protein n=1 Tax=Frankia sp. R82 TaxID=2950553 RepID=UPI002042F363|nr:iron-containing redox enzyme family protein [Frankia sp. R82]MCM3886966.1 iron-containing redox enzyme family protein [Frankia sp. R82]
MSGTAALADPRGTGYGAGPNPAELLPGPLPTPRGSLSDYLNTVLRRPPHPLSHPPAPDDDALFGEDASLALYCLYELHYRGFRQVSDGWEWEPSLLGVRRDLEDAFAARLRQEIAAGQDGRSGPPGPAGPAGADGAGIGAALWELVEAPGGPSLSRYLAERGTLEQFREFAIHRSLLQLKEADPHTWALPRLTGAAKAALVQIQADEYGDGIERAMHQTLFGLTLRGLGLDPSYGAYLDRVPATTIATVNLPSYLGLHRAHRAALVGHLAVFEMTSVGPMSAYSAALRRHGLPAPARLFFDAHVVADAHHQTLAADALAGGLIRAEPHLADDLLFGARAAITLEDQAAREIHAAWAAGRSSLHPPAV